MSKIAGLSPDQLPERDRELYFKYVENPIVKLEEAYSDERGAIQPFANEDMKSAVWITSKAATVRANHVHKTDWHYCYIVEGEVDYHHRPAGSTSKPSVTKVKKGQMVFTAPLVEHAMHFTQDTTFLCLGRNPRDQETYEKDIERVDLFSL